MKSSSSMLRCLTRSKLQPFLFRFPKYSSSSAIAEDPCFDFHNELPIPSNSLFFNSNQAQVGGFRGKGETFKEFEDSRVSNLGDCHRLAREGKLKEIRRVLRQMIDKEVPSINFGSGHVMIATRAERQQRVYLLRYGNHQVAY